MGGGEELVVCNSCLRRVDTWAISCYCTLVKFAVMVYESFEALIDSKVRTGCASGIEVRVNDVKRVVGACWADDVWDLNGIRGSWRSW